MAQDDNPGIFFRPTRHQMRRLRLLRKAYEEQLNEDGLRDHLAAGLPRGKYSRKHYSMNDLVGRAVDLFLAPFDEKAEELKKE